jgi:hypothetical protein
MPKEKIDKFFEEYKKTFVQANLEKRSGFFHYPCLIAGAGAPAARMCICV